MKKIRRVREKPRKSRERTIPVTEGMRSILEYQFKKFREKYGRDPGPDDPVFQPEDLPTEEETVALLVRLGISEEQIYAYRKVGVMVNPLNVHICLKEDVEAWQDAINQYRQSKGISTPCVINTSPPSEEEQAAVDKLIQSGIKRAP